MQTWGDMGIETEMETQGCGIQLGGMGHGNKGAYVAMEAVGWWKGSPGCQVQATEMWEDWASLLNPDTLQQDKEKKKKESILDLSKYIDKTIRVKFQGGREGE